MRETYSAVGVFSRAFQVFHILNYVSVSSEIDSVNLVLICLNIILQSYKTKSGLLWCMVKALLLGGHAEPWFSEQCHERLITNVMKLY